MTSKKSNLQIFFEDPNIKISIKRYSRLMNYGNSKGPRIIKEFAQQNYLKKTNNSKYPLYQLNTNNPKIKTLAQLHWQIKLETLIKKIKQKANPQGIILVKDIPQLNYTKDTEIILFLFSATTNKIPIKEETKQLGKKIKLIPCKKLSQIPHTYRILAINGFLLDGQIK